MKKIFGISAILIAVLITYSNFNTQEKKLTEHERLNAFFEGDVYDTFKNNFSISDDYVMTDKMAIEYDEETDLKVYTIPVMKNEKLLGRLAVLAKKGKEARILYENLTEIDTKGIVSVSTSSFLVAEFKAEKISGTKYNLRIFNVPTKPILIGKASKTSLTLNELINTANATSELPDPGVWYPSCVSQCYCYLSSACEGDGACDLACDLANIAGACTLGKAAFCVGYCLN